MRFAILVGAAAAAVAAVAPSAFAQEQEQAPTLGGADRPKVTFNEVEHGVYAGGEFGLLFVQAPGLGQGLGSGAVVGVSLGWDFSQYVGIGVFGLALSVSTPSGYQGLGAASAPGGDFTGMLPGLEVRLHLPIGKDANDVSRLFFNIGAGGGIMFLSPTSLFAAGADAPAARVDASLEYFTRIRHFSLGLAVEGLGVFPSGGQIFGGDLSPFVRYSF